MLVLPVKLVLVDCYVSKIFSHQEYTMPNKTVSDLITELETQFHSVQKKLHKAKDRYVASHKKDYANAKKKVEGIRNRIKKARSKSAEVAIHAGQSGTAVARNQLNKTKAAATILGEALVEAKHIMATAEDKLNTAKPFQKKLAARAKAIEAFEKEWTKKENAEAAAKAKRAAERKKEAKSKKTTTKPATKKSPSE